MSLSFIKIIPISVGQVNMTGLTVDLTLAPFAEKDGVRWQIEEHLSIVAKHTHIKFGSSFI